MDSEVEVFEEPIVNGMFVRSVDALGGTFKDVDEAKREVLVEFPHEVVDSYKTTFGHDAFRDSFHQKLPVMCWQHDLREPIGRALSAQITPRVNELVGKFSKFDAVPLAYRAFTQIQDGDLTDFSFGFRDPVYQPHPQHRGVRRIARAIMKEFSPVTVGSIPGAIATGTREEDQFMEKRSVDEILRLRDAKLISEDEARAAIKTLEGMEHIDLSIPFVREPDAAATTTTETGPTGDIEVPAVINAAAILEALPEGFQRALLDADARVWLSVGDEQLVPASEAGTRNADDGAVATLAAQVDAACESGAQWLTEVELTEQPESVRQAAALFQAAGTAANAMVEILDPDGSVRAAYTEPTDGADAEDMAPTMVKCDLCDGTGQDEDGKTCPQCDGSGIEAVTRAMPDDAPEGSKDCPTCKGKGKLPPPTAGGHQLKCAACKGKGWQSPSDQDDMDNRADASSWSTKPWSDFTQAKYTPEQWKDACLIVDGDGATKAQCQLPVKEPDGTYNVNGIAAAAGRLDQVKTDGDSVADAANALSDLYGKMGKDVPPEVSKLMTRAAEAAEDLDAEAERALARLNRRVPAAV